MTDIFQLEKDKMPFVPVYEKTVGRGKVNLVERSTLMQQFSTNFLKIPDNTQLPSFLQGYFC